MKTASVLLALVVVLGFAREAGAESYALNPDYTILIGNDQYGLADDWHATATPFNPERHSKIYLGPFGTHEVPFTATQGLVGFCVIVVGMVALLTTLTVRWKRKAT